MAWESGLISSGWGHRGLLELWHEPWSSLEFQGENGLLLSCNGNVGIPFPTKQGNGPPSRDEEGKTGLILNGGGAPDVPLQLRRVCWDTS